MKNKVSGVYKITNKVNNRVYIGESANLYGRWDLHKSFLKIGKHSSKPLQDDYNIYGLEVFHFEVIEVTEECRNRESFYIWIYDACNPEYGYNKALYRNRTEREFVEKVATVYAEPEKYLKPETVCEKFKLSREELKLMIKRGLPCLKITKATTRFRISEIEGWFSHHGETTN